MPPARSASAIVGGTVEGHHVLHIEGYSRIKEDFANGKSIRSRCFTAGDIRWCIEYYPNGKGAQDAQYISVYLVPDDKGLPRFQAGARFSLLDQAGAPVESHTRSTGWCWFSEDRAYESRHGFEVFIKEFLEMSEHLKDDCFKIQCDVLIPQMYVEDRVEAGAPVPVPVPVLVPPSDLSSHLGDLLRAQDGTDVTFHVDGDMFSAHKCVLAARSPVFKAQFFGAMSTTQSVDATVNDMDAEAFEALLAFLYTDTLPEFPGERQSAMSQHLLVAADKYNLERLKLICEDNLCKHVETGTAATILALAEQHNCQTLKKVCTQLLSSPSALKEMVETDGFEHLARSCPSVLKELISNISATTPSHLEGKPTAGTGIKYKY